MTMQSMRREHASVPAGPARVQAAALRGWTLLLSALPASELTAPDVERNLAHLADQLQSEGANCCTQLPLTCYQLLCRPVKLWRLHGPTTYPGAYGLCDPGSGQSDVHDLPCRFESLFIADVGARTAAGEAVALLYDTCGLAELEGDSAQDSGYAR